MQTSKDGVAVGGRARTYATAKLMMDTGEPGVILDLLCSQVGSALWQWSPPRTLIETALNQNMGGVAVRRAAIAGGAWDRDRCEREARNCDNVTVAAALAAREDLSQSTLGLLARAANEKVDLSLTQNGSWELTPSQIERLYHQSPRRRYNSMVLALTRRDTAAGLRQQSRALLWASEMLDGTGRDTASARTVEAAKAGRIAVARGTHPAVAAAVHTTWTSGLRPWEQWIQLGTSASARSLLGGRWVTELLLLRGRRLLGIAEHSTVPRSLSHRSGHETLLALAGTWTGDIAGLLDLVAAVSVSSRHSARRLAGASDLQLPESQSVTPFKFGNPMA